MVETEDGEKKPRGTYLSLFSGGLAVFLPHSSAFEETPWTDRKMVVRQVENGRGEMAGTPITCSGGLICISAYGSGRLVACWIVMRNPANREDSGPVD